MKALFRKLQASLQLPMVGSAHLAASEAPATPVVFIVDDDVSVRESLELLIRSEGWRAETFASARQVLSRFPTFAPDCLVVDVTLPGLDGLELQEIVTLNGKGMPIVFITGYDDARLSARAMAAGASEFLTKPFDSDVLLRAIRRAMERGQ